MKIEATPYLSHFSIFWTALNALPTVFILKTRSTAKIITGNPVPKAKRGGNNNPPMDLKVSGTRTPKNITPLYGQKAKANNMPNNKDPRYPLSASHSLIFSTIWLLFLRLIFITPNIIKPITINTGPKILSPQP